MLNEFFLYVLEDFHTGQSLGALKFTSDDPKFVKEAVKIVYLAIPATPRTPETRAFSRELIAYIAAFLPVATYYKAVDNRTGGLCDDQYNANLETLNKTSDEKFSAYLIRKTQAWFLHWATSCPDVAPAAAAGEGGGAAAATQGRPDRPEVAGTGSVGSEAGAATAEQTSPVLALETLPAVGRA